MFYSFSKPGRYHREADIENQDRICIRRCGGLVCAAVADGWGGSDLSQYGAEGASRAAAEYIITHFRRLFGRTSADALRYEVVTAVWAELDRLAAELGTCREMLASTLLVLCCDTADGRYLSLHIGDGLAARRDGDGLCLLSAPVNGITRQYATLTDSPRSLAAARVHRGYAPGSAFLLMTDGCTGELWDGAEFHGPAAQYLSDGDWVGFEGFVREKDPGDDHSFVALGGR